MLKKNPYHVIKSRHVTEKTNVLEQLQNNASNACVAKFNKPKYVFIVDKRANKQEIAQAIETIYTDKGVKVTSVNTIYIKPRKRRVRGRVGFTSGTKKAIVTLESGDVIEEKV